MLRSIYNLIGFTIGATDGEIGKVKNFYFDDKTWKVRYLIVETGGWLFGRKVLVSPVALQTPYWDAESFPVNLSKEQIKNSPDIDSEKPVSRQQEQELHSHYSWPYDDGAGLGFLTTGMIGSVIAPGIPFEDRISTEMQNGNEVSATEQIETNSKHDPHLRSFKEVVGYTIYSGDDKLGEVDDFLISSNWKMPYMVIETGSWYAGKKILLSTEKVQRIEWKDSALYAGATLASLQNADEYEHSKLVDGSFERRLKANNI